MGDNFASKIDASFVKGVSQEGYSKALNFMHREAERQAVAEAAKASRISVEEIVVEETAPDKVQNVEEELDR